MSKLALICIFLLNAFTAWADVSFTTSQQIIMSGPNCKELNHYAESIMDWAKSINKKDLSIPECYCSANNCQMDVAPISPYSVKNVTRFGGSYQYHSAYDGPNCFNSALVIANTIPNINIVHSYEMTAILDSPLCKERGIHEKALPGDILAVRDQSNSLFEVHAATYINEQLSFSKYGESNLLSYSYGLDVYKTYDVHDEACTRIEGIPQPGDTCYNKPFVNIYTCKPFYSFISQLLDQPEGLNERAQTIYAETRKYDLKISKVAYKGINVNKNKIAEYANALSQLYNKTEKVLNSSEVMDEQNKSLVRLMRFRIYSLYYQLRIIVEKERFNSIHPLKHPKLED